MAKQMSYTDERDVNYTLSYWRLSTISIDIINKNVTITFIGHKDDAARQANKNSVGTKSYSLSGSQYNTFLNVLLNKTQNPVELAYNTAVAIKDVNNNTVSFFENAADV